jgi:hypothetical protein
MPCKLSPPIGQKFNNWTVIKDGNKSGYWTCQCICGITKDVRFDGLKNRSSTNCGCIKHLNQHGLNETTLDRINNNSHYEPSNCRWATRKQQAHNSDRWRIYD